MPNLVKDTGMEWSQTQSTRSRLVADTLDDLSDQKRFPVRSGPAVMNLSNFAHIAAEEIRRLAGIGHVQSHVVWRGHDAGYC